MLWTAVVVALVVAAVVTLVIRVRRYAHESDYAGIGVEVATFVGLAAFVLGLWAMPHSALGEYGSKMMS